MKRIFLSLGFHGKSESTIINNMDKMKEMITSRFPNQELEFVHNYEYNGYNRVECLGEAIKKMSSCDYVYFNYNDIVHHHGCQIEKKICELYDIEHGVLSI